jgi:hypothetical protein
MNETMEQRFNIIELSGDGAMRNDIDFYFYFPDFPIENLIETSLVLLGISFIRVELVGYIHSLL